MKNCKLLLLIPLLLIGCTKKTNNSLKEIEPSKDNVLTIYTSHTESVYIPIVREFEELTGIWVQVEKSGTSDLLNRIENESKNPKCDVMFGGGVESLNSHKECFTPYVSSEENSLSHYFVNKNHIWTAFSALPIVIIYNPKLVKAENITGWNDLLKYEYRGKIALADPNVSASSYTAIVTMLSSVNAQEHPFLARFMANLDNNLFDDSSKIITAVESGEYLVGITFEQSALKAKDQEKNIEIVYPIEGTSCVPDGSAIVKGCKHLENAKRFIDFTVNYKTQKLLQTSLYRRPVRFDIPSNDKFIPLQEIKLIDYDTEKSGENKEKLLNYFNSFLGDK